MLFHGSRDVRTSDNTASCSRRDRKVHEGGNEDSFTIDTPRTSVVDRGTIFGLEVDDFGRTDVVVFSGMVDLTYSSDLVNSSRAQLSKQRLYMGDAVRVDTERVKYVDRVTIKKM